MIKKILDKFKKKPLQVKQAIPTKEAYSPQREAYKKALEGVKKKGGSSGVGVGY